jgi:hypothetical protein
MDEKQEGQEVSGLEQILQIASQSQAPECQQIAQIAQGMLESQQAEMQGAEQTESKPDNREQMLAAVKSSIGE